MTTIIIAEPIYKINIRYNEEIKNIEVLINEECKEYIVNIIDKDIPIPRFDLKTFYSLLHDILIKKKKNSKYNLNFKENKCYLHCSMELKDYLKTEYIFVLILKPYDKIAYLKNEIDLLKKENKELKEIINIILNKENDNQNNTESELISSCLKKSTILNCIIKSGETIISTKKKYISILVDIWSTMKKQKILDNTTFNFLLLNVNGNRGYTWNDKIKMSVQNRDANGSMKEIITMIKLNKYIMEIKIKLKNSKILHVKIE